MYILLFMSCGVFCKYPLCYAACRKVVLYCFVSQATTFVLRACTKGACLITSLPWICTFALSVHPVGNFLVHCSS
ncbi:uncharacterized protein BO97DRAFT_221606 [Aspergillus homomorphus CBS 101889]|uniref:Uncharacterized protein n=1 Tax=Aspergillus homomorphus (strain CBS 101889) TaxID=1450537 RepID=A0A395HL26_ASPHC|nr:hypothetical protein BO97DRAFT_221606 [Aspergillus homomorphus CBS 101889]RAL08306.1 hypothetical protein BO97DRAFT_221606 [Aspergillus homomorphus CBS 101889]